MLRIHIISSFDALKTLLSFYETFDQCPRTLGRCSAPLRRRMPCAWLTGFSEALGFTRFAWGGGGLQKLMIHLHSKFMELDV